MDIVIVAFLSSLCLAQLIFIIAVLSFLTGMTKIISSVRLNPQPEPPKPDVAPVTKPTPVPVAPPESEEPEKDEGLTLEDFVPDLTKPVKVVVKPEDADEIEEDKNG